jgi:probable F420-dependent oxidoreductase
LTFGVHYRGEPQKTAVVDYARRLQSLGFDGFWCSEGALGNDPFPLLAAATAVSDLRIGTSVLVMPFHDPTVTARSVATLDRLSGGRFTLGVGVGGERLREFDAYNVEPRQRGPRTNEALALMLRLWQETDVRFEGRYFQTKGSTLAVRPAQQPHPPIWVGGRLGGQGKSRDAALRRAARYGDGWLPYLVSPEQYAAGLQRLAAYAASNNRPPGAIAHALQVNVAIYETKAEAMEAAMAGSARGYGLSAEQVDRYYVLGTAAEVIARIAEFAAAAAEHFIVQWACRPEDVQANLDTLARDVIPEVLKHH